MGLDLLKGEEYFRYGTYSGVHEIRALLLLALVDATPVVKIEDRGYSKRLTVAEDLYSGSNLDPIKIATDNIETALKVISTDEFYSLIRFVDHSDCDGITTNKDARNIARWLEDNVDAIIDWYETKVGSTYHDNELEVEDFKNWINGFIEFAKSNTDLIRYC